MKSSFVLLLAVTLTACAHSAPASSTFVTMPGPVARPFSAAVISHGMIYLAGQLGTDASGQVVAGGIGPETRQAMENIKALFAQHGATMDDVVKCTVMLADIREWGAMNEVYVTFFPNHRPARSAFGTSGLALGARVEIECMAAQPAK